MKNILLILVIIFLFLIKAWPVALVLLVLFVFKLSKNDEKQKSDEPTMEELKKENEILRKELGEQAVRHAIEKADSREKNG